MTLATSAEVIKCKVTDGEEIWNPSLAAPGQDLINSISFTGCKAKPLSSAAVCGKATVTVIPRDCHGAQNWWRVRRSGTKSA
ncbi:MAG TPA: hypothetical protein VHW67_09170 [Solirubrobacteraceae bacterium]|nr:hypothetical protein [Solirubrobacteraceae bacterium]